VENFGEKSDGVESESLEVRYNGGEYTSKEFKDYLASKGIKYQLSISGRPEQNEVAERMNLTLTERAHSIRLQADMSEEFWAEAVNHASYLVNMSPSTAIDLQIPEEIWRGVSVDYSTLRIFGCPACSFVDGPKRNKLEFKSKKCIFIGFTKGVEGFRLWDPEKKSAFTSRDVVFDEDSMLREKPETKDKAQGGASNSSATDTEEKGVKFSDSPKGPEGSEEDSSDSDGDKQEANSRAT